VHLVIVGGKSAGKVKDIVSQNFDNMDITIYNSVGGFIDDTSARLVYIDRILLLQDSFSDAGGYKQEIKRFNDFVCKKYVAARVIILCKDEDFAKFTSEAVISPYSLSIFVLKLKSQMILDIVSETIDVLRKKYVSSVVVTELESFQETVFVQPVVEKKKEIKKEPKKGFFSSLFGGVKKDKTHEVRGKQETVKQMQLSQEDLRKQEEENTPRVVSEVKHRVSQGVIDADTEWAGVQVYDIGGATELGVGDIEEDAYEEETVEEVEKSNLIVYADDECEEEYGKNFIIEVPDVVTAKEMIKSVEDLKEDWESNVGVVRAPRSNKDNIQTVDDNVELLKDLDSLEKVYHDKNVKIVERIVEKIITVDSGKKSKTRDRLNVIVTGDRKTGVTRTALNLASVYSSMGKTLFVDLDIKRRGSVVYLGIDNLVEEGEHIQNGLNNARSLKVLPNVCYKSDKHDFSCLVSMYGFELDADTISKVQSLLIAQKHFEFVVIDCPLEYLPLLDNILHSSALLVCCENTQLSIINTVISLDEAVEGSKLPALLVTKGSFLVTRGSRDGGFSVLLKGVSGMFNLDEREINWCNMNIAGDESNLLDVVKVL